MEKQASETPAHCPDHTQPADEHAVSVVLRPHGVGLPVQELHEVEQCVVMHVWNVEYSSDAATPASTSQPATLPPSRNGANVAQVSRSAQATLSTQASDCVQQYADKHRSHGEVSSVSPHPELPPELEPLG
jgi:hypothetical protein